MSAKQYADASTYEGKLSRVMERMGVSEFNYNWDRYGSWIEFRYKNNLYRFDHSVENAKSHGVNLRYGSDAFAQLILSLEDLARMIERGIYDLSTWVAGMRYLPPPTELPECFRLLGFLSRPESPEEVRERYRELSKKHHPDVGGREEDFRALTKASEQALGTYKT